MRLHWYSGVKALMHFYMQSGIRLAFRVLLPLAALSLGAMVILRPEFFYHLAAAFLEGRFLSSAVPTTALLLIIASLAAKRISCGNSGWIMHLPAGNAGFRHAACLGVWIVLLPVLLLIALLALAASRMQRLEIGSYLAGLPLAGAAAALITLRVKRRMQTFAMASIACLCLTATDWIAMGFGAFLLFIADAFAGPLKRSRRKSGFSRKKFGIALPLVIIWRAMGIRLLIPYIISFFPILFLFLFLSNNPYEFRQANAVFRLCACMSCVLFTALFCHILSRRRPPWGWEKSLPRGASARVLWDFLLAGTHVFPLILVYAAVDPMGIIGPVIALPAFLLYCVLAMRREAEMRFGAGGAISGAGAIGALLIAISGWAALFIFLFIPLLWRRAAACDRLLRISRWDERSHIADGDSLSWSGG